MGFSLKGALTGGLLGGGIVGPVTGALVGGGGIPGVSSGGGSPPQSDYLNAARVQGRLSNPNVITPFGSQSVTFNPDDTATVNKTYSPLVQGLIDRIGSPFDMSKIPDAPVNPGMTGQNAIMSRLQPQIDRERAQLKTELANQGIPEGSEAYTNAMKDQDYRENDLLNSAALSGINLDTGARQNAFQEQAYQRSLPINELNSLTNAVPFQPYQAPPIFNAAQAQGQQSTDVYNAQQAMKSNMMGGLMGLGGTLGAAALLSDRRAKTDIKKVGQTDSGLPVYTYKYKGDETTHMGVMAQDVEKKNPEAVVSLTSGLMAVDYSKVH